MAQEVGVAYVALLPSAKGFGKAVEGEIDGAVTAGEKKANGFFGKVVKGTALAVAGAVTAVGAITLGKGISRALNIEDAQAKLKGLGHDAQSVDKIMTDALNSVRGTAFGLDTAASVASTAVAAGIKPGQELEKYLRLTADAATIAGVSMEEMGSILNKTTTAGKVYTSELNQLADRGLPIFQWLQEEYGVTSEELSKMVSSGQVDAETFRKVIEENIGGAALASGDTTRGAFANMGSAFGRLGAIFAGPGLGLAKDLFNEITAAVDGVTAKLQPLAGAFGAFLDGINLDGMGERFAASLDSFDIGALITSVMEGRANLLSLGFQIVDSLLQGLISAIPQLVSGAAGMITQVLGLIVSYGPSLVFGAVQLFTGLVEGLITILPTLIATVVALVPQIAQALMVMIPELLIAALDLFMALVEAIPVVVPLLISSIVGLLPQIATALIQMIPALIEGAIALFMAIVEAIPVIIPILIQSVVDLLPVLITTILSLIPALINGAIALFIAIVEAIPIIIPALIDGILNLLPVLITTVIGLIPQLIQAAITLFTALVEALPKVIPKIIDAVIKIGPKLVDAVIKMAPLLFQAGIDLVKGLGEGIMSMADWLGKQISKLVGGVVDWAKDLLGIASPSKVFFEIGGWTGEGFADGIAAEAPGVRAAIDHMVHIPDSVSAGSSGYDAADDSPWLVNYGTVQITDEEALVEYVDTKKRRAKAGVI